MRHRNLSVSRDAGLRRLSRLTWRATLLSVVAAFGMTTLFAKTAAHSVAGTTSGTTSSAGQSPSATPASSGTPTGSGSPSAQTCGVTSDKVSVRTLVQLSCPQQRKS